MLWVSLSQVLVADQIMLQIKLFCFLMFALLLTIAKNVQSLHGKPQTMLFKSPSFFEARNHNFPLSNKTDSR